MDENYDVEAEPMMNESTEEQYSLPQPPDYIKPSPVYNPRPISHIEAEKAFSMPNPTELERNENVMMGREDNAGLPDWSSFNMFNKTQGGRRSRKSMRKSGRRTMKKRGRRTMRKGGRK